MQRFEQAPCSALRPFVKRFLVVEYALPRADIHFPDACPVAAFTFRGQCRLDGDQWAPSAALTGMRERKRFHEHGKGHAVLLVIFEPTGPAAFLRNSQEEFSGATTDLKGLIGSAFELEQLSEALALARNHARRVMLLEKFLVAKLRASTPDLLVTAAIAWLDRQPGAKRIDQLARYIGLSQSALERRFRRVVGLAPKRFASLIRFRQATEQMASGADLSSVAHTVGYFDQAHFISDFRHITGTTPAVFNRNTVSN